jgi:hypothetical protein
MSDITAIRWYVEPRTSCGFRHGIWEQITAFSGAQEAAIPVYEVVEIETFFPISTSPDWSDRELPGVLSDPRGITSLRSLVDRGSKIAAP